jgi:TolB protein
LEQGRRIFLKTAQQDGSQGEPLRELPWDFAARYESDPLYYDQGGKLKNAIPAGYYVDFTALAADYGWSRVPALDNWRTFFQGIRYWHFENRQGLTWEEAIRELYSSNELARAFGDQ